MTNDDDERKGFDTLKPVKISKIREKGGVGMRYRITYESKDGFSYTEIEDQDEEMECGSWTQPFPNTMGDSQAFGLEECITQSDDCPAHFYEVGIEKITVERYESK